MTIFVNSILESNAGYSAVFACIGLGFIFLRRSVKGMVGPGYWAASFFMNSIGFFLWSTIVPSGHWQYFLAGEIFHMAGFIMMVLGAYRFSGNEYKTWNAIAGALWFVAWLAAFALLVKHAYIALILFRFLRSVLFIFAGIMLVVNKSKDHDFGRWVSGLSLIAWGLYISIFSFVQMTSFRNLAYGLLVGFQVLAGFGLVAMVINRMRTRAEESERRAYRLEGLLPICSYCKNIRDKNDTWHTLELYIEKRSKAEFTHGICPECFEKHRPDR